MIRTYKKGDKTRLYKNFRACEFDCHSSDCSETIIDDALVARLQTIRDHFNQPITITSGYRCPHHNAEVGGASKSYHVRGQAADIVVNNVPSIEVAKFAESIGVLGIGWYEDFVHIDTRTYKSFWKTSQQIPVSTFGGNNPPDEEYIINPLT